MRVLHGAHEIQEGKKTYFVSFATVFRNFFTLSNAEFTFLFGII